MRLTASSASCSVASAAGSATASTAQNRGRLTRTYQLDSSSTKSISVRTPAVGS